MGTKRAKNAALRGLGSKACQRKVPIPWHCPLRLGLEFMGYLCSCFRVNRLEGAGENVGRSVKR